MKNIFTYSFYQRNPVFFTAYCTALYTYPQNEEKNVFWKRHFIFYICIFIIGGAELDEKEAQTVISLLKPKIIQNPKEKPPLI